MVRIIHISIIFYYLVVRKLFSFVSDDYLNVSNKDYHSTPPIKSSSPAGTKKPSPPPPPKKATPPPPPPKKPSQKTSNISNVTGSTPINNI